MSLCAGSLLLGACAGKGEQKMSVSQEPDTLLMLVGSYASADQEGIRRIASIRRRERLCWPVRCLGLRIRRF